MLETFHDDMNDSWKTDDEHLLDLLVDGELDEDRRRHLLLRLEHQPDGWRRCAAAFLEAQCWAGEARAIAHHPPGGAATGSVAVAGRLANRRWYRGPAGTLLAMAASFLAALTLGLGWRGWNWPVAADRGDRVDTSLGQVVDRAPQAPADQHSAVAGGDRSEAEPIGPDLPWRNVTLLVDGRPDGSQTQIQVPVVEQPSVDDSWLRRWPAAMSPEVLRLLERSGHQVRQQRQWMPFDLEDGRRVVVPVDQVEVRPADWRSYQ